MKLSITSPMCYGRRLPDGRYLSRSLFAGGQLGLGKLIGFYDHNGISIDGEPKAGLPTIPQNDLKPITGMDP